MTEEEADALLAEELTGKAVSVPSDLGLHPILDPGVLSESERISREECLAEVQSTLETLETAIGALTRQVTTLLDIVDDHETILAIVVDTLRSEKMWPQ